MAPRSQTVHFNTSFTVMFWINSVYCEKIRLYLYELILVGPSILRKTPWRFKLVHHKSHMDPRGIEAGTSPSETFII
jgi:hypothetical protein